VTLSLEGDMLRAEQALAEANFLNPYNSDVWGYLTLLCLENDRVEEANRCVCVGI
jgi:Flp pilus assembly protein TadD